MEEDKNGIPNGTVEDKKIGVLHSVGGYFVNNKGTKVNPSYHVWITGIVCATCDSAYSDLSCAVARCNFLARNKSKIE